MFSIGGKMDYSLKVNQSAVIRRGFFTRTWSVVYAGAVSEQTYSLAVLWSFGHQAGAYNLFLQMREREVPFLEGRLVVHSVSPDQIRLSYER